VFQRTYPLSGPPYDLSIKSKESLMASQGNSPNKGNQKGGQQNGSQNQQDVKRRDEEPDEDATVPGANQTGNKSQGGKFDSGNQTNR
jgi:hypothetical protein